MTYAEKIANAVQVRTHQIQNAIQLFEEGNTIPFIARYRKEMTGGLDEEQLRQAQQLLEKLHALDERRKTILASIEEQGKLTPELQASILHADSLTELEDFYAPYRPKRRTRAATAREKGLQPLADLILQQACPNKSIDQIAGSFLNDDVLTIEGALSGARDIVAETISDHAEVRARVREKAMRFSVLRVEKIENAVDERNVYQTYYQFESRVDRIKPHQVLALNRGEKEKVLRIRFHLDEKDWLGEIQSVFSGNSRSPFFEQLKMAVIDSAERLLLPAIERDVRRTLTETAEIHAIRVFAENVRALLSQPPLKGHIVMGIDPGFRTGCKLAVVDQTGKVLTTSTIYPHEPHKQHKESLHILIDLIKKYQVSLIAIGNGTASRETEQLVAELVKLAESSRIKLQYLITSEAGASVYSASPMARQELPNLDVSLRGAVSIARRVQDPLAELVKIDPKSIGVGLYQHDVDQAELSRTLTGVVEDVVNWVGVDVNTASPALLTYVSGIGHKLAETIIAYRDQSGSFKSRTELKKIPKLGEKTFEQCAGFLRILGGQELLDATAIHPESYPTAKAVILRSGIDEALSPEERRRRLALMRKDGGLERLASELGVGLPTLTDICDQLARPGRDPRSDAPPPILRSDVLKIEDLVPGMQLKGTVRNVVDFGAFVDIGVKQDGLLHRTQYPHEVLLKVGDLVEIKIISIDLDRQRISLGWAG